MARRKRQLARRQTRPGRGPSAGQRSPPVRMRMPSRRNAIAAMTERILEALGPLKLSRSRRNDLAMALAEALANAAIHGNALDPTKQVSVVVHVQPGRSATIDVRDSGPGFDRALVPDPTQPSNLLSPQGRGLFLMRRLVDDLEYNDAGNRVRLTVRKQRRRASP